MRGLAARFSSRVAPTGPAAPARRSWPAKKQTYHAGAEGRRRAAVKPRAPPPPLGEEFLGPVQPCASADRRLGLWWTEAEPPDGQLRAAPRGGEGARVLADAQADMLLAEASSAICVQRFDDSRTVQVTLRIAFRCVLHRCESQDIRC